MNIKSSQDLVAEANKSIKTLDAKTVKSMHEKDECVLIDVRDIRELWKEGTVKNAKHIPRGMLEFWLDRQCRRTSDEDVPNVGPLTACSQPTLFSIAVLRRVAPPGFQSPTHFHSW